MYVSYYPRNWQFGYTWSFVQCQMAMKICTQFHPISIMEVCENFHGHPTSNVRLHASKLPFLIMEICIGNLGAYNQSPITMEGCAKFHNHGGLWYYANHYGGIWKVSWSSYTACDIVRAQIAIFLLYKYVGFLHRNWKFSYIGSHIWCQLGMEIFM